MRLTFVIGILGAGIAFPQPFIYGRGVVNAANFLPAGIPAGAIGRGSIFTVFGRNLGPASGVSASAYPLSTALNNVVVTISQGATTVNALPVYVSAGQVNAIMPSNAPLGTVAVRVLVSNVRSNPAPVRVANGGPGIFTVLGIGAGPAVVQNFVTPAEQPVNSLQVPATPGQTVTLWATGLGPVAADNVAPTPGNAAASVEVFVGGKAAKTAYSGRAPCCAGTDQIVFQVPPDSLTGCWVPVYLRVAGTVVSNIATIAITPDGSPCDALEGKAGQALIQGTKLGLLAPLRSDIRQSSPNTALDLRTDFLVSRFSQEAPGAFAFNPLFSLPPAGGCTAYAGSGDWFVSANVPGIAGVRTLDSGGATVSGGGRSATFSYIFSPLSLGYLGAFISNVTGSDTTLLAPGQFTVQSTSGDDVGAVNAAFTMPAAINWTNRDQISVLTRKSGLTVNFTGAGGQAVALIGGSVDLPTNSSALFVCAAQPGAASITVPPDILSNLPQGRGNERYSKAILFLAASGPADSFIAGGIDAGVLVPLNFSGKAVTIQ